MILTLTNSKGVGNETLRVKGLTDSVHSPYFEQNMFRKLDVSFLRSKGGSKLFF
jgi:hypothetical protein